MLWAMRLFFKLSLNNLSTISFIFTKLCNMYGELRTVCTLLLLSYLVYVSAFKLAYSSMLPDLFSIILSDFLSSVQLVFSIIILQSLSGYFFSSIKLAAS